MFGTVSSVKEGTTYKQSSFSNLNLFQYYDDVGYAPLILEVTTGDIKFDNINDHMRRILTSGTANANLIVTIGDRVNYYKIAISNYTFSGYSHTTNAVNSFLFNEIQQGATGSTITFDNVENKGIVAYDGTGGIVAKVANNYDIGVGVLMTTLLAAVKGDGFVNNNVLKDYPLSYRSDYYFKSLSADSQYGYLKSNKPTSGVNDLSSFIQTHHENWLYTLEDTYIMNYTKNSQAWKKMMFRSKQIISCVPTYDETNEYWKISFDGPNGDHSLGICSDYVMAAIVKDGVTSTSVETYISNPNTNPTHYTSCVYIPSEQYYKKYTGESGSSWFDHFMLVLKAYERADENSPYVLKGTCSDYVTLPNNNT